MLKSLYNYRSHEWEKHGSCASGINSMADEHGFFNTTLALHERMNYTTLLSNQGIEPSYDHKYKVCIIIYITSDMLIVAGQIIIIARTIWK